MSEKLNIKEALSVFNKVTTYGEKNDSNYELGGLTATSSFDGYSVTLSDHIVTLNIHFHNKFDLEHPTSKALDEFMLKLNQINENKFSS